MTQELPHCDRSIPEPPVNSRLAGLSGRGRRMGLASSSQLPSLPPLEEEEGGALQPP